MMPCARKGCDQRAAWVPRIRIFDGAGRMWGVTGPIGMLCCCEAHRQEVAEPADLLGAHWLDVVTRPFMHFGQAPPATGVVEWEGLS